MKVHFFDESQSQTFIYILYKQDFMKHYTTSVKKLKTQELKYLGKPQEFSLLSL